MKNFYLIVIALILAGFGSIKAQVTFNYTGAVQLYTVPCGVTQINVDVRGAQGNINQDNNSGGGLGGRVQGTMTVVPCEVLQIYVGGGGVKDTNGGFNGGGNAGNSDVQTQWLPSPACPTANGGGGGGGSDIRTAPYTLNDRQVVGGGGGGTGGDRMVGCGPGAGGGGGGGYYGGGGGGGYSGLPGTGGSQAAGGLGGLSPGCAIFGGQAGFNGGFGFGGAGGDAPGNNQAGNNPGCVGGAGGTLTGATGVNCTTGGCPGTWSGGSGGGGSNFQGTLTAVTQTQGFQSGNGIVIITAVGGCIPLTAPTTFVDPTCGNCNGSITVTPAGGSMPYTYLWAPGGQTTATITGLCANSYTVTVTDACGSTIQDIITLTSTSLTVAANITANEPCNGNCVGSANAVVTGGVAPFTYLWTPTGGTNATATGLCAGIFTITVTDINGCSGTATATITQPTLLTATATSTNILCNGGANGTATVTPAGGTAPYTYLWTPGGQTNTTATGLSVGNYTITVTDNNGCVATATVSITQPPALTATISAQTNVLCNGANTGSAAVTAGGGSPGYTYNWTPIGGIGPTGTGLSAGTYTVTVTDANGCTATASVTITQPPLLTATIIAQTNVLCNPGNNGTATVSAGGGTPGYTYNWTPNGGNNAMGTGLTAGSYTVTVTDANGCTATAPVTITQPTPITTTISFTPASCNLNNGSATVVPAGGSGPYTYFWNPGGNTNATATGLSANTYTVLVTDNNGCTATASIAVTQPSTVTATISASTNILCNGANNGTATVSVVGGSGPYTYLWTPGGQTTPTATGLSGGTYTISVTDNVGCISTASVTITEPPVLTATIGLPINVSCNGGANGSATVTAGGGSPGYSYNWTPLGGTGPTGTGLTAGTYTATVTDANGCTATATVTITEPVLLTAAITVTTNITCNGASNGSSTVIGGGGTFPYSYLWTPGGNTNATATALTVGTYTVTITDGNGCTATASTSITQPTLLTATIGATTNVSCFGGNNGSATVTAAGGTPGYNYLWSNGNTTANPSNLSAGTFTITITDANGCTASTTTTIAEPTKLLVSAGGPQTDCSGAPINLSSTVSGGTAPYTYNWTPTGGNGSTASVTPGVTTTYTLTVTDANGCIALATVTVIVEQPLSITVTGKTSVCAGGSITLTANASGGDGNYNYLWLPSNQTGKTITISPTSSTAVTVELTDGCGSAMATLTVPITVNPSPTIGFSADVMRGCVPLCIQFRDMTTITSGGFMQWNWNYGNNDSSNTQSPVYCYKDTGVYNVSLTVTSDSGCSSTLKVLDMIQAYPPPNASFTYSPQPINILSPTVQFTDQSSDKYQLTDWFWRFGDGMNFSSLENPQHAYGDTGTYCATLIVMDVHGCVDSITNCFVVNPDFAFYIPDAFSPNGDGVNDVFMPKGSYIKNFEMYIFDRWGMQLFHSTDINTGWNGTVKNGSTICQEDTYVYLINVIDSQGNKHSYTGKVSLLK